ncbi:MAG TPA: hypothetical protein VM912_01120, partial [Terriglobales bacterium]|nr:hypothetical protein [Terriglobales bacterium]
GNYRHAFAVLLVSALLCLGVLLVAWFLHRRPDELIGIGATVARGPLPHHRAYGSVHGGSSQLR